MLHDIATSLGSPPRVRGKQSWTVTDDGQRRITPACAGKTTIWEDNYKGFKDHPRVCGENGATKNQMEWMGGSPPRVRGKLVGNGTLASMNRITPACAGKTPFIYYVQRVPQDHPRVCGENH